MVLSLMVIVFVLFMLVFTVFEWLDGRRAERGNREFQAQVLVNLIHLSDLLNSIEKSQKALLAFRRHEYEHGAKERHEEVL